MPNTEVIEKWVAALESGDYKQTVGKLQRTSDHEAAIGFCCLGVLCDLAVKENVVTSREYGGLVEFGEHAEDAELPNEVRDWAGLDRRNPAVRVFMPEADGQVLEDLMALNDSHAWNFEQIAEAIRENYLPKAAA